MKYWAGNTRKQKNLYHTQLNLRKLRHLYSSSIHSPITINYLVKMLKILNSRCRNLTHPLITTLFSHLHTSEVATLLTGLQPPSTPPFHGHGTDPVSGSSQVPHPWPEWEDLMELLLKRGYFDGIGNPSGEGEMGYGGKDSNLVRTAFLNFGRDRVGLLRWVLFG